MDVLKFSGDDPEKWIFAIAEYFSLLNTPADQRLRIVGFNLEGVAAKWFRWMSWNGLITILDRFVESAKNRFGPSKYEDPRGALSKLLHLGTVKDYQREFEKPMNRVTDIPDSLLISFYISGLKLHLQRELLASKPMNLGYVFLLARIIEVRFEAIAEKEHNIKKKVDTTLSLPKNGVEYVRALNAAPLEVVFAGPVDEVSSVIEDVFDIDESNVEGMQVRDKFAEFFKDKGSVKKVLSATKLSKGGNSHSAYFSYHLEDKVNFEGVGNVTPWAAEVERRKRVKCYRKKEKSEVLCPR
ncbi:hypothetical protein Tco_1363053 [Tanacetum coccineum]